MATAHLQRLTTIQEMVEAAKRQMKLSDAMKKTAEELAEEEAEKRPIQPLQD